MALPERSPVRRAFLFMSVLLLAGAMAASAQAPAGAGQIEAREARIPCVLVATGDGTVRAVSPQSLSPATRRKLRTARLRTPGQRPQAEGPVVTTSTANNPRATADITVNYTGFTEQARQGFQRAVDIWARHIESSQPIVVDANFRSFEEENVLGSAGPNFFYRDFSNAPKDGTFYPHPLAEALAEQDISGSTATSEDDNAEIIASFNSDFDWFYGDDIEDVQPGQFDFTTVVLHELGHGLGFLGSADVQNGQGSIGLGDSNFPMVYDTFTEDPGGTSLLNNDVYPNPSEALADVLTDRNPNDDMESTVLFDGEQARLGAPEAGQSGSPRPKLFTPDQWDEGSSYSHLDEDEYPGAAGDPDALMTPQFGRREAARSPGGITCGIFGDMGWELGAACQISLGVLEGNLAIENAEVVTSSGRGNQVRLEFANTVANADRFVISRCFGDCGASSDMYETVATVQAQSGQTEYEVLVDVPTPGRYTFRVELFRSGIDDALLTTIETQIVEPEGDFSLSEAFPNPARSRTELRLVASSGSDTEVTNATAALYDSRGRRVRPLDIEGSDGQATITVSAGGLASGVYYVRVEGDDLSQTRSVVVVQ